MPATQHELTGVLLLTDPGMAAHAAPGHPERPERLEAVAQGVADGAAAAGARLDRPAVVSATAEEIGRVHPAAYLAALDRAAERGGAWLDGDTYVVRESMVAARLAAGAAVQAARSVAGGQASIAMAVGRPPGHHAAAERPSGFCLLNNVAVAAEALRADGLAERVAIVDWDVHHGDGTQALYDEDPAVCYASTHQMPLFPGSGDSAERGRGAGNGTMHNAPLPPGSGDAAFLAAWEEQLLPAVEAFGPDAILASAGYDGHRADPLAHLEITEAGYEELTRRLGALCGRLGLPGIALCLEGGYDLPALRASSAATIRGFLRGLGEG